MPQLRFKFITRKKPSPTNMKVSSSANANEGQQQRKRNQHLRKITSGRRAGATFLSALAKTGILPNGSVIRISRMVVEAKL